jgi:hypothetical protein
VIRWSIGQFGGELGTNSPKQAGGQSPPFKGAIDRCHPLSTAAISDIQRFPPVPFPTLGTVLFCG